MTGVAAAVRQVCPGDLNALYEIALATGDGGDDASAFYQDPKLVGHIYAAPYAVLCPDTVFVAYGAEGIGGYIVGTADTRAFEAQLEKAWWPGLRAIYPETGAGEGWLDAKRIEMIHRPACAPDAIVAGYPAHLHINLLPRLRGCGVGRALMERWLLAVREQGARGVHLAVGARNTRAIHFYGRAGFRELHVPPPTAGAIWLGRLID
jgi:ribosomal protein S18 acetylase RimI-like enzyme